MNGYSRIVLAVAMAGVVIVSGCHKKETAEAPVTTGEVTPKNNNPTAVKQAESTSPVTGVKEVQAAMEAKNYDQATTLMLNMQRSVPQMTPEQAAAYANQMRSYQQSLAAAAAAGDQRAVEAARRLAQSRHR